MILDLWCHDFWTKTNSSLISFLKGPTGWSLTETVRLHHLQRIKNEILNGKWKQTFGGLQRVLNFLYILRHRYPTVVKFSQWCIPRIYPIKSWLSKGNHYRNPSAKERVALRITMQSHNPLQDETRTISFSSLKWLMHWPWILQWAFSLIIPQLLCAFPHVLSRTFLFEIPMHLHIFATLGISCAFRRRLHVSSGGYRWGFLPVLKPFFQPCVPSYIYSPSSQCVPHTFRERSKSRLILHLVIEVLKYFEGSSHISSEVLERFS